VATLVVPAIEATPYPTLGPQVAAFVETYGVFGPGDLRGQRYHLSPEKRALLYRMYEVQPPDHPQAGRRRFRRVAISQRKGTAKTEFGSMIVVCELHPDAPVRCVGWERLRGAPEPVGRGVIDPYIPLIATTEEQSDELAFGALKAILENSPLAEDFDIGLERIMRRGGDGKAVALAGAPDARDGARTTFSLFDETHRWTSPRQKQAHRTMLANLPKRRAADPWALEITTAFAPGEGSVAEDTMEYARAVATGERDDARLFFFHRQAAPENDFSTPELVREGILEASGADAEWSDVDGICDQFADPTADRAYLRRVWGNQLVRASERAFDALKWRDLARRLPPAHVDRPLEIQAEPPAVPDWIAAGEPPPDGELIAIGFDGSRLYDATGIVGTHIKTGYLFVIGAWERPEGLAQWEVPAHEVDAAMVAAFGRWDVWRLNADPPYWDQMIGKWTAEFGAERVLQWRTQVPSLASAACLAFRNAIESSELSHDGNPVLARHVGNACRRELGVRDDQGVKLWSIQKERQHSPHKIDLAMAAVLSWRARLDAIAAGATGGRSVYEDRGVLVL